MRETIVTNCEKRFVVRYLSDNKRINGRDFDEFRTLTIDFGTASGCCCVSLGDTRVLAHVSCEVQTPKSTRPNEGVLNINVELNPMAAAHFEVGRQTDLNVQLNRLLEKNLKDSRAVDLESLCIKMNEKVWALRIDVNVLNHAGNIVDCASVAAVAALAHFRRPDVTCTGDEFTIHSPDQRDPIQTVLHHYPVCVTYAAFSVGQYIVADPDLLEENVSDAQLTIGLNAYRELCTLHLGGKVELSTAAILQIALKATGRAESVVEQIKSALQQQQSRNSGGFSCLQKDIICPEIAKQQLVNSLNPWRTHKAAKEPVKKIAEIQHIGDDQKSSVLLPIEEDIQKWHIIDVDDDVVCTSEVKRYSKSVSPIKTMDSASSEEDDVILLAATEDGENNKK